MTVVYIDSLFLLNLLVDYLLLLGAGRLAGEPLSRVRLGLGAGLGAAYAAAVFLPGTEFLLHPLWKAAVGAVMVLVGYGGSRRLGRVGLAFFALACAFGGGVFALGLLGSRGLGLERGVLCPTADLRLVLLSAAGCYGLFTLVFRGSARHGRRELAKAVVTVEGRQAVLTALVDTGNTLTDPVTGKGVMVAEGARAARALPEGLGEADLASPVEALEILSKLYGPRRFRLIPYRAVGVECGMLVALRADQVRVGDRDRGELLVALSPTPVSDGGGYCALIGAEE